MKPFISRRTKPMEQLFLNLQLLRAGQLLNLQTLAASAV